MSLGLQALLAFSPILLAAILLIGLHWPAKRAMPAVFILTAAIALFGWEMSFNRVLASTLQGAVITLSVLWIIFGAILLHGLRNHHGDFTQAINLFLAVETGLMLILALATLRMRHRLCLPVVKTCHVTK